MRSIHCGGALLCGIAASVWIAYTPSPVAAQGASGARDKVAEEYAASLPKDVYPDSGSRFPLIKREDLKEEDRKIYDMVVGETRSRVGLRGPSGIRLYSPRLTEYTRRGTTYLRWENGMGDRLSELAILVTARELDQQFEWTAHEPAALKAGLEPAIIDIVKYRKPIAGMGEKEAAIIQLGREAVGKRKVSPDTFARALKLFGRESLVNLVALMGQYSATAVLLNTFDQHVAPGEKLLLPMP